MLEFIGCIMELLGIILMFKGCGRISDDGGSGMMLFGLILMASAAVPFIISSNKQQKDNKKKIDDYKIKTGVPSKASVISYIGGLEHLNMFKKGEQYYIWKDYNCIKFALYPNRTINLVSELSKGAITDFNINDIEYYNIVGDAYTETNVTGGGSSLTGAIVGGVVAGGAGAVIGSRKEIKTETNRIDNRKTIITYKENNSIKTIFLSPDAYEILLRLIPHKDINFIQSNNNLNNSIKTNFNKKEDIYGKIRELSKLKDEGILTEEEFNEKKKILLEKII